LSIIQLLPVEVGGSWPEYTAMCTGSYAVSQTFV